VVHPTVAHPRADECARRPHRAQAWLSPTSPGSKERKTAMIRSPMNLSTICPAVCHDGSGRINREGRTHAGRAIALESDECSPPGRERMVAAHELPTGPDSARLLRDDLSTPRSWARRHPSSPSHDGEPLAPLQRLRRSSAVSRVRSEEPGVSSAMPPCSEGLEKGAVRVRRTPTALTS